MPRQSTIKECYSCHRRFTEESFRFLELCAYPDFGKNTILEVRECRCGILIGVERDYSNLRRKPVLEISSHSDVKGGIHERIAH